MLAFSPVLSVPFISGETRHARRAQLFDEFRRGDRDLLVVSRVGDEGIDLPDAELAVVASGLGGSRRQGTQRAGRTMRPVGRSQLYVLATPGTEEEDFARQQMRHLASKGCGSANSRPRPPARPKRTTRTSRRTGLLGRTERGCQPENYYQMLKDAKPFDRRSVELL
jgi:DNA excision repair protein ERCC-3